MRVRYRHSDSAKITCATRQSLLTSWRRGRQESDGSSDRVACEAGLLISSVYRLRAEAFVQSTNNYLHYAEFCEQIEVEE